MIFFDNAKLVTIDKIKDISFEGSEVPDYITGFNCPLSASEELSFECEINSRLFSELTGANLSEYGNPTKFTVTLQQPYQVQIRRHRKKRINKKWAKQYGYKTKFKNVELRDCELMPANDCLSEFIACTRSLHTVL